MLMNDKVELIIKQHSLACHIIGRLGRKRNFWNEGKPCLLFLTINQSWCEEVMNWVLLSNLSNFLYVFPAVRFAESANFSIERIISNACNPNSLGSCVGYKLLSLLNQYSSRSQMMIDKKTWRRFIIMMASYCVALKQLSKRSSSHWPSHAANQILAALSRWWCWDRAYKAWGHIFRPESCDAKSVDAIT